METELLDALEEMEVPVGSDMGLKETGLQWFCDG